MSFVEKLKKIQKENSSHLCVGLDIDPTKIGCDPVDFGKRVIEETKDLVCAYKANLGFYLAMGEEGIRILQYVVSAIPSEIPWVLDAKFGDIANSSEQYAKFAFEILKADGVTLNPYMGLDAIQAFARYEDRYSFILTLTSNPSAADFQTQPEEIQLYRRIARKIGEWGRNFHNLGMVLGGTQGEKVRAALEENDGLVLVPGIGSQGGNIEFLKGTVFYQRLIVNVARSIIYSESVRKACEKYYRLTCSE